ncbi:MAG: sugar phosphate isomerase/epimerase [Chloroflexi bacterium]|nr:sugar phosphate isomerase/epimerase [Chloroflexota bacterium]
MSLFQKGSCFFGVGTLALLASISVQAEVSIPDEYKIGGYAIGCQAYSFNRFSAFEAIEKTAQAGGRVIEFYPGQRFSKEEPEVKLDHNMSDEHLEKLKAKLKQHHLMAVNYGVVGLPNDEQECRKVFGFAKKLGLRAVTSEPSAAAMDLIEKLVKEYDIAMAVHNHPKRANDPNYKFWDPNYVLSLVKDRDPRLGSCADTGHFVRSGLKPVEALKTLKGRIISSHLKDLHQFSPGGHDVPFGTGVSDIPAVLDELKQQGFEGNISIEYEYNWDNSVPDIAQCIGFVCGYTTGKK